MTADLLVAVLASPPTTSGDRTRSRVELVRTTLGARRTCIANLFPIPTHRTTDITRVGIHAADWLSVRPKMAEILSKADAVLLAYGVSEPTGDVRALYRDQLAWLGGVLAGINAPLYQVGGAPRHPSRWQRWTSRTHPDLPFRAALDLSLSAIDG